MNALEYPRGCSNARTLRHPLAVLFIKCLQDTYPKRGTFVYSQILASINKKILSQIPHVGNPKCNFGETAELILSQTDFLNNFK